MAIPDTPSPGSDDWGQDWPGDRDQRRVEPHTRSRSPSRGPSPATDQTERGWVWSVDDWSGQGWWDERDRESQGEVAHDGDEFPPSGSQYRTSRTGWSRPKRQPGEKRRGRPRNEEEDRRKSR